MLYAASTTSNGPSGTSSTMSPTWTATRPSGSLSRRRASIAALESTPVTRPPPIGECRGKRHSEPPGADAELEHPPAGRRPARRGWPPQPARRRGRGTSRRRRRRTRRRRSTTCTHPRRASSTTMGRVSQWARIEAPVDAPRADAAPRPGETRAASSGRAPRCASSATSGSCSGRSTPARTCSSATPARRCSARPSFLVPAIVVNLVLSTVLFDRFDSFERLGGLGARARRRRRRGHRRRHRARLRRHRHHLAGRRPRRRLPRRAVRRRHLRRHGVDAPQPGGDAAPAAGVARRLGPRARLVPARRALAVVRAARSRRSPAGCSSACRSACCWPRWSCWSRR